jgi:hypothetical protein
VERGSSPSLSPPFSSTNPYRSRMWALWSLWDFLIALPDSLTQNKRKNSNLEIGNWEPARRVGARRTNLKVSGVGFQVSGKRNREFSS